jgi:hypothetical protein
MSEMNSSMGRREFLIASALAGAAGVILPASAARAASTLPAPSATTLAPAFTAAAATTAGSAPVVATTLADQSGDASIRPFQFQAPDEALADLRRRVRTARWPSAEYVPDASQGVRLATMRAVARHWAEHDWRRVEARLNALPQFLTNIDGVDIHFIHVRSRHPIALPVIVTHGWPGSIIEQLKIIAPLADPTAHGGSAADAFDVVIPSLPGHGFSGKPTAAGWDPIRIARAWAC